MLGILCLRKLKSVSHNFILEHKINPPPQHMHTICLALPTSRKRTPVTKPSLVGGRLAWQIFFLCAHISFPSFSHEPAFKIRISMTRILRSHEYSALFVSVYNQWNLKPCSQISSHITKWTHSNWTDNALHFFPAFSC